MFANLSQGNLIHILSLNDNIKYSVGTIESVSYSNNNPYQVGVQNMGSFLTLRVNLNGKSTTIEGIPANSTLAKTNDFLITENKEIMIAQTEGLLQASKDIVNNIDKYKNNIEQYNEVLKQLSPQYAKESDRDNAISDLYTRVGGLDSKLDSIISALSANNKNSNSNGNNSIKK